MGGADGIPMPCMMGGPGMSVGMTPPAGEGGIPAGGSWGIPMPPGGCGALCAINARKNSGGNPFGPAIGLGDNRNSHLV